MTDPSDPVVERLRAAGVVFAEEEAVLLREAAGDLDDLVARRAAGEPLEPLLGWAAFDGLRVPVDPHVFVPRRRTELLARWHKSKTAHFRQLVADGAIPPRSGIARIIPEALDAGWTVAVASTSAQESVRAVLQHAVGVAVAARVPLFAGDVVPAKKPDPAIYQPLAQMDAAFFVSNVSYVVRVGVRHEGVAAAMRKVLRNADPTIPVETAREPAAGSTEPKRL